MPTKRIDPTGRRRRFLRAPLLVVLALLPIGWALLVPTQGPLAATDDDTQVAMSLANLLRAARSVISRNQELINNPDIGDKGLTGDKVLADAIVIYKEQTGEDPADADAASREGKLLRAQMNAIRSVMDENQSTINAPGVGFKGFIPAVFARLVNENFAAAVGDQAKVKVTAPEISCGTARRFPMPGRRKSSTPSSLLLTGRKGTRSARPSTSTVSPPSASWCRSTTDPRVSPATASPRAR